MGKIETINIHVGKFVPYQRCKLSEWIQQKVTACTKRLQEPTIVPEIFFRVSYFLVCSPYYFTMSTDGRFIFRKWVPQEMLWVVSILSSFAVRVSETRLEWLNERNTKNPMAYFAVFYNAFNLAFNSVVAYTLWCKREKFLYLFNYLLTQRECLGMGNRRLRATIFALMVQIGTTIIALPCFIFGIDIFRQNLWNPRVILKCLALRGRYLLFITDDCICPSDCDAVDELTHGEIWLGCLFATMFFIRKIVGFYENVMTMVGAFVLWIATYEFTSSLHTERNRDAPQSWIIISRRYKHLKTLTNIINDINGLTFLAHFMTAFFFYSTNLEKVIAAGDPLERLKLLMYYVIFITTVLIASDICKEMGKLEHWLGDNLHDEALSDLSQKELTIILHELQVNRISLSGSGLFTMTYSLAAQVTGVIITYFIISLQNSVSGIN